MTSIRSFCSQYRIAPLALACLPVALSFLASVVGSRASSIETTRQRPPLAFHQYQVNLGKVEPRRDHFGRFTFTNNSNDPIELRRLETSCGCLTQHQSKQLVAPGADGEFFLRIQSANQEPGAKSYTCKAIYGPQGQPNVEYQSDLRFLITLPELTVVVRPRVLVFHQPNGNRTTSSVTVTDLRDRALKVVSASADSDLVTVKLDNPAEFHAADREAGVVGRLEVSVGEVPPGRHDCEIRLVTDDREFNVVKIPVQLHGPARRTARSRPSFEPLDASDDDPPR